MTLVAQVYTELFYCQLIQLLIELTPNILQCNTNKTAFIMQI